jgi:cell division protease FtsH
LHAMANALLERETLDAEEIKVLLEGGTLDPVRTPKALRVGEAGPEKVVKERPSVKPEEFPRGIPPLPDPDASA